MNSTLTSSLVSSLITDISQICRLFKQVPVAMSVLCGPDHLVGFANEALFNFWERPAEEVLGRPAMEVFPGAVQEGFGTIFDQVYLTGESLFLQDIPSTFTRNNVTRSRNMNIACHPFGDQSGAVTASMVTVNESTDQKRVEEDLQRFQFMANHAGDAFILTRADGSFAYLNRPAIPSWGYTEAELQQLGVPDIDPIYTETLFSEAFTRAQTQRIPPFETLHQVLQNDYVEIEIRLRHFRTGEPIWMNYAVFTIKNDRSEIVGIATISRNIDENKKVEQALYLNLERFRLLADSMPQFVWSSDEQRTLNYINQSVCTYSGLNPTISLSPTMELASIPLSATVFLKSFNGCTAKATTAARASGWLFAKKLSKDTVASLLPRPY